MAMKLRTCCNGQMDRALLLHATSGVPAELVTEERRPDAVNAERASAYLRGQGIVRISVEDTRREQWLVQRRGALVIREELVGVRAT